MLDDRALLLGGNWFEVETRSFTALRFVQEEIAFHPDTICEGFSDSQVVAVDGYGRQGFRDQKDCGPATPKGCRTGSSCSCDAACPADFGNGNFCMFTGLETE